MDIQVNRNQVFRVVIKWLNKNYGNLTQKTHKDYPNKVFYVNSGDYVMMEHNQETNRVWIDREGIWSKVESIFHLSLRDVRAIMSTWLEETYKLEGVMPLEDTSWQGHTI
jgi:hypothetical protein